MMRGNQSVPSLVPKTVEAPRFRDLRVRMKLMILHNVFFLGLTAGVYYSVIPLVQEQVRVEREAGGVTAEYAESVVVEAQLRLFAALGLIYVLAVLALELLIMPRYVYEPIQATLEADEAVQEGDRDAEIIAPAASPAMRSATSCARATQPSASSAKRNAVWSWLWSV
jgi:hypothetical protein